ncbi:DUF72 domain-containing protein [Oceanicoccus sp. KOV_DT_Chl]|uniref:DUF72 domain-containing protein n=1 Tax=Oceanicoccus sp. KOV_DT_Chl TaxID=1904639 RepID=UPI001F48E8DF|nr:DUF72 domain-containing protein [Oceanicoccus sp. KOV_DT_Chl]
MNQVDNGFYHLGLPMWSNRQWLGSLFPAGANSKNFLQHYSSVFASVEGNTTFYATPDKAVVQSWKSQAHTGFRFCFKLPRKITHENNLRYCGVEFSDFLKRLEPLAENLGSFMIQLPDSFAPRQLPDLQGFLKELPADFQFSVEVRHLDFFNRGDEEKQLNQLLRQHNVDRVCFDSRALFSRSAQTAEEKEAHRKKPRLPVHAITTAKKPIIRFIGGSDFHHNEQYLLPWVKKIAEWQQQGIKPTVFIHTPDNIGAPEQAAIFHQLLKGIPGWQPLSKLIKDEMQTALF